MYPIQNLILYMTCLHILISICNSQSNTDDIYTFCGKGRPRGDNTACEGYCKQATSTCSAETGICTCLSPVRSDTNTFDCKPARSRTRCKNACSSYSMITPQFRRGEIKVCQSKMDNRRMCFCLPKA